MGASQSQAPFLSVNGPFFYRKYWSQACDLPEFVKDDGRLYDWHVLTRAIGTALPNTVYDAQIGERFQGTLFGKKTDVQAAQEIVRRFIDYGRYRVMKEEHKNWIVSSEWGNVCSRNLPDEPYFLGFHGTKVEYADNILKTGFDPAKATKGMYGPGVYMVSSGGIAKAKFFAMSCGGDRNSIMQRRRGAVVCILVPWRLVAAGEVVYVPKLPKGEWYWEDSPCKSSGVVFGDGDTGYPLQPDLNAIPEVVVTDTSWVIPYSYSEFELIGDQFGELHNAGGHEHVCVWDSSTSQPWDKYKHKLKNGTTVELLEENAESVRVKVATKSFSPQENREDAAIIGWVKKHHIKPISSKVPQP